MGLRWMPAPVQSLRELTERVGVLGPGVQQLAVVGFRSPCLEDRCLSVCRRVAAERLVELADARLHRPPAAARGQSAPYGHTVGAGFVRSGRSPQSGLHLRARVCVAEVLWRQQGRKRDVESAVLLYHSQHSRACDLDVGPARVFPRSVPVAWIDRSGRAPVGPLQEFHAHCGLHVVSVMDRRTSRATSEAGAATAGPAGAAGREAIGPS